MKRPQFSLRALFVLIAVVASIAVFVVPRPSVPLRSPHKDIYLWLLKKTPLGITFADFEKIAQDEHLGKIGQQINLDASDKDVKWDIRLGSYHDGDRLIIVEAVLNFGTDDKLKDIEIRKPQQI
jgi:hypothetical protein